MWTASDSEKELISNDKKIPFIDFLPDSQFKTNFINSEIFDSWIRDIFENKLKELSKCRELSPRENMVLRHSIYAVLSTNKNATLTDFKKFFKDESFRESIIDKIDDEYEKLMFAQCNFDYMKDIFDSL